MSLGHVTSIAAGASVAIAGTGDGVANHIPNPPISWGLKVRGPVLLQWLEFLWFCQHLHLGVGSLWLWMG